jgi:putative ABC transport system ATP-binding protein
LKELLVIDRVNKYYGTSPHGVQALRDISFTARSGDLIGVIGKSGAGKSTLINLLAAIDRPTSGNITVMDTSLSTLAEDKLAVWRGLHIGVVYQTFQLLNQLTVLDNILLAMDLCGKYRERTSRKAAMRILRDLEIEDQADKFPGHISGGQMQRAAIARALANDPPLLLADEPTGNLDTTTASHIFTLFQRLAATGRTIIVVTHDRSRQDIFTRVLQLKDGEIIHAS